MLLEDTDDFRGSTTDVECGTAVDRGCTTASYEAGSNAARFGRCPGCEEARLRVWLGSGALVAVALGTFGLKAGGGTASAS